MMLWHSTPIVNFVALSGLHIGIDNAESGGVRPHRARDDGDGRYRQTWSPDGLRNATLSATVLMLVIHAGFRERCLVLWGESSIGDRVPAEPGVHPFSASYEQLADTLESISVKVPRLEVSKSRSSAAIVRQDARAIKPALREAGARKKGP